MRAAGLRGGRAPAGPAAWSSSAGTALTLLRPVVKTADGAAPGTRLLEGKPVVLVTTRGGAYGPGTPRAGWDHSTDYLRRILADVWGAELTVIEREFTLVGVNPALDEFSETAGQMKLAAEEDAAKAGRALADRYLASAGLS